MACSTADKNSNTPEGLYAIGEEYESNDRYDVAIQKYQDVRAKFPYSAFAPKAELAIANIYFKQESYAEAQLSYQSFRELHPKHSEIAFVLYRIGLSYFNQLPKTIDRDLSLAKETIAAFDNLLRAFPQSQYAKEAIEKKNICIKMLAEKEEYIADFYFIRKKFLSALARYEDLYENYAGVGLDDKAIARAAICAHKINNMKKFEKYKASLLEKFPQSSYTKELRKEIN